MPRTLNPCSYLPRRLQIVASILLSCLIASIFLSAASGDRYDPYLEKVPYGPELQAGARQAVDAAHQVVDRIPANINPFRAPAHTPPPEQANSTSGEAKWFSDFKWQNPFSSSITFDEDRSVLPPEKNRPLIYTYFDAREKSTDAQRKKAELELIHVWRRAWWAKGFQPVVLGPGEAMNNPMYRRVLGMKLGTDAEFELLRWLAWGNMGTGILCNWLALPMAPYDDPFFNFLRRGDFPILTSYSDLGSGFYVGSKAEIEKAIKLALDAHGIRDVANFVDALPRGIVTVDSPAEAIAYYSGDHIASKYQPIREKIIDDTTVAEGLAELALLINSHLHMTWQNQFELGIYVLKPIPHRTTSMIEPAIEIARNLSACSHSPLPNSCPPNRAKCHTCVASQPLALSTPPIFRNWTNVFTIGTVPHPFTLNCLFHQRETLNLKFIRRQTMRDKWIVEATKELLGTGKSAYARLVDFKDAVASDFSQARTLWITAEHPFYAKDKDHGHQLDWIFGFRLPRAPQDNGKSETPVPGPERRPPPPKPEFGDTLPLSETELTAEKTRLEMSKTFIEKSGKRGEQELKKTKEFVEAWNLADAEAWKFVRAFNARRIIERQKWEEQETTFLQKGTWDRWVDKLT